MNYLKKVLLLFVAAGMVLTLSSCEDLVVQNENEPDRERALSSPGDIETLISGTFRTYYYAGESYEPNFALSVSADELTSSWGNFGMQDAGSEPREPYNNDPSYGYSAVAEVPFQNSYAAVSSALDGLSAINEGTELASAAATERAKAFAQFVIGLSHMHVATVHDKGFVVNSVPETNVFDASQAPFEIKPAQDVFAAGADYMSQAISTAESAPNFTIPGGWMGTGSFTKAEFIGIMHTYRAHYRAAMARSPEQRRNIDWQAVIDDINNGYTEMNGGQTFMLTDDAQENWFSGIRYYGKNSLWTRVDIRTIGPADKTDAYENWKSKGLNSRTPFTVETDDRRITGSGGPETDGKYFGFAGPSLFPESRGIYHYSYYTNNRNIGTYAGYGTGNEKWIFTDATMRLLKAEALLHQNAQANKQQIVDLINESRVNVGELPAASLTDPVGSMSDAQDPIKSDSDGATLWSMLKHEKRIESFGTACGVAFYDDRGWGDLVEGTFEDLPIPGEELLILEEAIYTSDLAGGKEKGYASDQK